MLPLHGESTDDLTNISEQAHSVSLKFFAVYFSQWQMTNTFKQTNRKLTAISHSESSGELSVSMMLAHTFTGKYQSNYLRIWNPKCAVLDIKMVNGTPCGIAMPEVIAIVQSQT